MWRYHLHYSWNEGGVPEIYTSKNTNCIPHCPTCNSSSVEKISVGKKIVGGAMFGVLSSDVRASMYCKNCGYKWWNDTDFLGVVYMAGT